MCILIVKFPHCGVPCQPLKKSAAYIPQDFETYAVTSMKGELPESQLHEFNRFFLGCKMASSDSEFLDHTIQLLSAHEPSLQPIKAIIQRAIFIAKPEECPLEKDSYDHYAISIVGEGIGHKLYEYEAKIASIYNQLLKEKMSHLMHPGRHKELIEYLGKTFADKERAAERLISYRCYGYDGLKIAELSRELDEDMENQKQIEDKLAALAEEGPKIIRDLELQESDLTCIEEDARCKEFVCLIYNHLASQEKLGCLSLPIKELYNYHIEHINYCDRSLNYCDPSHVHADLAKFVQHFYIKASSYNFNPVVRYVKALKDRDLNALRQLCLKNRLESIRRSINRIQERLAETEAKYTSNKAVYCEKKAENYLPGDFSFVGNAFHIRTLTNVYNAFSKLNRWSYFDNNPTEGREYEIWGHSTTDEILKEVESDGHSGMTLAYTFEWMMRIHKLGWNAVVNAQLENNAKQLGVLNRVGRCTSSLLPLQMSI